MSDDTSNKVGEKVEAQIREFVRKLAESERRLRATAARIAELVDQL